MSTRHVHHDVIWTWLNTASHWNCGNTHRTYELVSGHIFFSDSPDLSPKTITRALNQDMNGTYVHQPSLQQSVKQANTESVKNSEPSQYEYENVKC